MKRILLIIFTVFLITNSFAQTFVDRGSAAVTNADARLKAKLNFYLPWATDTTLNSGLDSLGALLLVIKTGDTSLYMRIPRAGGNKWAKMLRNGDPAGGVLSFNTRTGNVTLTSSDVTTALGYIPPNPNGTNLQYIAGDGSKITFPTIPAQFNPLQGYGITITGPYPNKTFTADTATLFPALRATLSGGGGLSSVGLSMPAAFNVANSPLSSNGTITVSGAGNTGQYIRGNGSLATFPTIPAQFNPIAGTNVTITGTYPNLTFNSTGGGGGGVSSIATNNGTGITGGTITSTGTLALDTANKVTSKDSRQKLGDSLGLLISAKQPTGNYITALTGDVVATGPGSAGATISANAVTTTKINNNAVTYGKMQPMTANKLLGSGASGTAVAEITLGTGLSFTGTTLNATGGGSGTDNTNIGSFYRWLNPATQGIKTAAVDSTITLDSTSNTNALTHKLNSNLVTYANYFNKGFPFNNQSIFYGTSITFGFSNVTPYPNVIQGDLGNTTITNVAVSSTATRTASKNLAAIVPVPMNGAMIGDPAFNNSRWGVSTFDTSALFGGIVNSGARDIGAMQFANNIQFYRVSAGTVNPNVTTSGSAVTALPTDTLNDLGSRAVAFGTNIWWKQSITANETVTITNVQGSVLYVRVWADSLGGSRIQYAVDGVTIGTYNPNNKIIPGNIFDAPTPFIRGGIQNDIITIHGLADTLHTIVLTFLDGSTYGGWDCVGGLKNPLQASFSPYYVLDVEHMSTAGYSLTGGSAAIQDSCSNSKYAAILNAFPEYYAAIVRVNPNTPVGFYDASDPAQTQNNGGGDVGIHPSGLGHRNIALSIESHINPKAAPTGVASGLNPVLIAGNTSSQIMNLSGFGTSDSKLKVGAFEWYPFSSTNTFQFSNIYLNGTNYIHRNTGEGTLFQSLNNSIRLSTFESGTAGSIADGNLRTPFVISPDHSVGLAGNMSFDNTLAGAIMEIHNSGSVIIPTGTLAINQSPGGLATVEVTGTGYFHLDQNGNTFFSMKNGTAGANAQTTINLNNDNGEILQQGIYSSATSTNGGLVPGIAYIRGSGTAGLALAADNASAPIKFLGNSFAEIARFNPSGELQIGSATDQGAFTLQNTGGLYQNGTVKLAALPASGATTDSILTRDPSTGNIRVISASSIGGGRGSDTLKVVNEGTPGIRLLRTGHDTLYSKIFSATNGLTGSALPDSTLRVVLGGELTQNTSITGTTSTYSLSLGTTGNKLSQLAIASASTIFMNGRIAINQVGATDADLSVPSTCSFVTLNAITANRVLTLSVAGAGAYLIVINENTSGNTWSFAGTTVKDAAGNTLTTLANGTSYQLLYDGTNFIVIGKN